MSEKKIDIPKLMRSNELFQAFMDESIEPIWCFEFDEPNFCRFAGRRTIYLVF